jgi:hypothetical protein
MFPSPPLQLHAATALSEFIGWAAEEVGLRGANEIAQNYADNDINVIAVYHNEMSGYEGGAANRHIVLLQDFVDNDLQDFNEKLINEYCDIPAKKSICGYGCSDHAAWSCRGGEGNMEGREGRRWRNRGGGKAHEKWGGGGVNYQGFSWVGTRWP